MECFHLIIIVPVREVISLEIFLELFPHIFSVFNLLYLPKVLPPNGCYSIQVEDCHPSLHISWIVLDLEIFIHPKNPIFNCLSILYLTVKGRRPFLFELVQWIVSITPPSLFSMRWRARTPSGSLRVRWPTRIYSSPSGSALTTLWFFSTIPRAHLTLDFYQTLQHGFI